MAAFQLNWFDLLVGGLLIFGLIRGRKRGMSEEILSVTQTLLMVFVCAQFYKPLGQQISQAGFLSTNSANLLVYIGIIIVIFFIFSLIRKAIGEKLLGADVFGKLEYYLGMMAGVLRYICIIIMFLAMMHSQLMTTAEMNAGLKKQKDQLGNSFFPTMGAIQQDIYLKSYSGRFVKTRLPQLLISPTEDQNKGLKREGPAKRNERAVDEVLNGRASTNK